LSSPLSIGGQSKERHAANLTPH